MVQKKPVYKAFRHLRCWPQLYSGFEWLNKSYLYEPCINTRPTGLASKFFSNLSENTHIHIISHTHARARTHTHIHTHIYIYMCVCVCIENQNENKIVWKRNTWSNGVLVVFSYLLTRTSCINITLTFVILHRNYVYLRRYQCFLMAASLQHNKCYYLLYLI